MLRVFTIAAATLILLTGARADEQMVGASCVEPKLNIDVENESQIRLLEHDFVAYEACVIDYVSATHKELLALEEAVSDVVNEESSMDDDEAVEFLEGVVEAMEMHREAIEGAKQNLEGMVRAILDKVPAKVFNQWNTATKVGEP